MQLWAVLFFINNSKYTLHVSEAFCAHHQDYVIAELIRLWHSIVDKGPWTSLLDIHHSDSWQAPATVTTAFSTPDDGRRKRPKHVEGISSC